MLETTNTIGPRTTDDSNKEGRMKVDMVKMRKKKRKILERVLNKKY